MEDLLAELNSTGWRLLSQAEYPPANADAYVLEHDTIVWGIVRDDASPVTELQFHAFADLGQRTNKLTDIFYCEVMDTRERLYFEKRDNPEWRHNLALFVRNLNRGTQH